MRRAAVGAVVLTGLFGVALASPRIAAVAGLSTAVVLAAPVVRGWVGRLPWAALTLGVLAAAVTYGVAYDQPTEALGLLLVYLQVHQQLTRASESDDRKAVVLAGLMLVTAAGTTREPLFGGVVAMFGAALAPALTVGELRAWTAIRIGAVAGPLAFGLFLLAPRGNSHHGVVELTGFASEVRLGALDALLDDPSVVFRAAVRPPRAGPVYWRGVALDVFDGAQWISGSTPRRTRFQPPSTLPPDAYVVEIEPIEPGVLFTAGWPLSVDVGDVPLWVDSQNGWTVDRPIERYRIVAQGGPGPSDRPLTPPESDADALARAAAVPPLDPRVAALAAEVAGDGPALEQAQRLSAWLRAEFTYTRHPADAATADPLARFLFERRSGHCEYFASALAVMLRTRGIPARVVNGFVGGAVDASGWLVVRRSDAHTWVELHDDGWWLLDPTPGPAAAVWTAPASGPSLAARVRDTWDERVLAYDRADQVEALLATARAAERLLPFTTSTGLPWRGLGALALVLIGGVIVGRAGLVTLTRRWFEPRRSEPVGPVARAHHRARAVVASRGFDVPPGLPPVDAARWVRSRAPSDASDALVELAWLYYEVHLGRGDAQSAAPVARRLLDRVRALPDGVTHRR